MSFALSASRVQMFEMCPLQYHHAYIKKTYTTRTEEELLLVGSLVHEALERLAEYPVEENIDHCVAMSVKSMTESDNNAGILTPDMVKQAVDMIKNWFDPVKFEPECLGTEEEFDFTFGGVRLRGYIDRAEKVNEDTIRIIDYKSGGRIFTESEMSGSNQLLIYAMAAYEEWQPESVIVCYDMILYDRRVEVLVNEEDIREKFEYLKMIYDAILRQIENSTTAQAITGSHCVWCNYKNVCPDYKLYLTGDLLIPSIDALQNDDFENVMSHVFDMEEKRRVVDEQLKLVKKWITNEMLDSGKRELLGDKFKLSVSSNTRVMFDPTTVATIFPDKLEKVLSVKKGEVDKFMKSLSNEERALLMTTARKSEGAAYLRINKR